MTLLNRQYTRTIPLLNMITTGQSNIENAKTEDYDAFRGAFVRVITPTIFNGAKGGQAISKDAAATADEYYWDHVGDVRGDAYTNLTTKIGNNYSALSDVQIDVCFCAEQDAGKITSGDITKAYFKAALDEFLDQRQAESASDYKCVIGMLGRRPDVSNDTGYQQANEAIRELIAEKSILYKACETYDLNMKDTIHRENGALGLSKQLVRTAWAIEGILGLQPLKGVYGPQVLSATRDGTTVTCTVTHDNGDDIVVASGAEDIFRFEDDGSPIDITGISRTSSNTFTLTLDSTPTGVETLYIAYGCMSAITVQDDPPVVKDNSSRALPLQGNVITL